MTVTNVAGTGTRYDWGGYPLAWTSKTSAPTGRSGMAAGAVNGRMYVAGGYNGAYLTSNYEYDPATNAWVVKAALPSPRYAVGGAALNGKLYALGGYNGLSYLANVDAYDPVSNAWTSRTAMTTARSGAAAATAFGRIFAIGGVNGVGYQAVTEEYDPGTNAWIGRAAMTTARFAAAAAVLNGKIHVVGGYNGILYLTTHEAYDPVTNTWSGKAAMPTARNLLAAFTLNGRLYAVGGYNGVQRLATVEVYDPATDAWTTAVPLSMQRDGTAAAVIGGKAYVVGGYTGAAYTTVNQEGTPGLAPGVSYTFTVTGVSVACTGTAVSNTAWAAAAGPCASSVVLSHRTDLTAGPGAVNAGVSVSLSPATPAPGGPVQYLIVVTNTGSAAITTVTVTDTVPTSVPWGAISTSAPAAFGAPSLADVPGSGTRFTWSASSLNLLPGGTFSFMIAGTAAANCTGAVGVTDVASASFGGVLTAAAVVSIP
ncbi:MAG: kelch repeat-containing protein, partial [bacterium]